MPLIKVDHLLKAYKSGNDSRLLAVNDISFEIEKGEFVAICGPSGSGKTTLLSMIAGMTTPTEGDIHIGKYSLNALNENQKAALRLKKIGIVYQSFNLIRNLTAAENVALPLLFAGNDYSDSLKAARNALKEVDINSGFGRHPFEFSGGQQQRICIARAIVANPSIILADEPTGNLDSENSNAIMNLFCDLLKNDRTILMITHNPICADFADRILTISDGRLISDINNRK